MEINFFFPVSPVAVQSARFRRAGKFIRSYQPEKVTDYKKAISILAREQLPEGFQIFQKGIAIESEFIYPCLKSFPKKLVSMIEQGKIIYKITRPDLTDNLHKALNDALSGVVWKDDGLIAAVSSRKIYGITPGIKLRVFEL